MNASNVLFHVAFDANADATVGGVFKLDSSKSHISAVANDGAVHTAWLPPRNCTAVQWAHISDMPLTVDPALDGSGGTASTFVLSGNISREEGDQFVSGLAISISNSNCPNVDSDIIFLPFAIGSDMNRVIARGSEVLAAMLAVESGAILSGCDNPTGFPVTGDGTTAAGNACRAGCVAVRTTAIAAAKAAYAAGAAQCSSYCAACLTGVLAGLCSSGGTALQSGALVIDTH
jgi:hypothetical protein